MTPDIIAGLYTLGVILAAITVALLVTVPAAVGVLAGGCLLAAFVGWVAP